MKKVLSCLLAVLLLASFCAMAFADDVVPSVESKAGVPEVESVVDADENDVAASIVVTPITEAETLSESVQAELDDAVAVLEDLAGVVEANEDLKALVGDKDVAVDSIFNMSATGEVTFPLTLRLKLENPDNFAALLQFVENEPKLIETELEDDVITFTVESLGNFVILSFADAE